MRLGKNIRWFIYVSLLIHIVAGMAFYIHHHPLTFFAPQPVSDRIFPDPVSKAPPAPVSKTSRFTEEISERKTAPGSEAVQLEEKKTFFSRKTSTKRDKLKARPKNQPLALSAPAKSDGAKVTPPNSPPSPEKGGPLAEKKAGSGQEKEEGTDQGRPASLEERSAPVEQEEAPSPDLELIKVEENEEKPSSLTGGGDLPKAVKFRSFFNLKQRRGNPSLNYPQRARKDRFQGVVSIIYFVTADGLVDKIQLKKSSGTAFLDNFVLRTIARYEFLPGQEGWVRHTVEFKLKGEEQEILKLRDGKDDLSGDKKGGKSVF